jgi:tRNA A-37 threonylcarbamoyl transferase component Bud32
METAKCKQCGAPLSSATAQGLCPKCLMEVGMGTQERTALSDPVTTGPAPVPEDFAKWFPQLEIIELLGQGGMGIVYKARQPKLDRMVALKVLPLEASRDPHFAERFAREAKALARLNHPNIVAVHDSGQAGEYFYFIMEYVEGTNLRQMMRAGQVSPREALVIVPRICEALQYAHEEGVVHRDIKPENVLVDKKGRVKIADFGLAKLLGKDSADLGLTASGAFMGTPKYMAPEQIEKPQEVDHRADIYSVGVVFYEMLTGELPLGRFAVPSKKVQIDVRLDEVVLRTLEKEPDLRYQNVSQLKDDVENISGIVQNLPPSLRSALGFEYKSKANLVGLPLIHVAYGTDIRTGKKRVACGVFAFGDIAKGVFAFGGVAFGLMAFGGVAIGVVAMGGLGLGLLALSGLGIGLLGSYSGVSIAPVAMGGLAVGWYAMGGMVFGKYVAGGNATTPEGMEFFRHLPFKSVFIFWLVIFFAFLFISMVGPLIRMLKKDQSAAPHSSNPKNTGAARQISLLILITVLFTGVMYLVLLPFFGKMSKGIGNAPARTTVLKSFQATKPFSFSLPANSPTNAQSFPLFEVPNPDVENCAVIYRASLKAEDIKGRAYLEMLCRFPGSGESFSRGLDTAISGTKNWTVSQTRFFLKPGEKPDLIRLNLALEGGGTVSLRDAELLRAPLD